MISHPAGTLRAFQYAQSLFINGGRMAALWTKLRFAKAIVLIRTGGRTLRKIKQNQASSEPLQ